MHFADVVLQVKCCREVGLTVILGTNQHRLMGSMDPFVPPQSIRFLEHLLTHLACKCSYDTFLSEKQNQISKKLGQISAILYYDHNIFTWMFGLMLLKFPPGVFKHLAVSMRAAVTCMNQTRAVSAPKKIYNCHQLAPFCIPLRNHTPYMSFVLKEFSWMQGKVTSKCSHNPFFSMKEYYRKEDERTPTKT